MRNWGSAIFRKLDWVREKWLPSMFRRGGRRFGGRGGRSEESGFLKHQRCEGNLARARAPGNEVRRIEHQRCGVMDSERDLLRRLAASYLPAATRGEGPWLYCGRTFGAEELKRRRKNPDSIELPPRLRKASGTPPKQRGEPFFAIHRRTKQFSCCSKLLGLLSKRERELRNKRDTRQRMQSFQEKLRCPF